MKPANRSILPAVLAICGLHFLHPFSAPAASVSKIPGNNTLGAAQNLDGYFTLDQSPMFGTRYEATSTLLPHVSVYGFGDKSVDYYSFTAKKGDRLVLDVDFSGFYNMLQLFDPRGQLLQTGYPDDIEAGGTGSFDYNDAFLEVTAPEDGRYVVALGLAYVMEPIPDANYYNLNISVGSPHAQVFRSDDIISKELPGVSFASIGNPAMSGDGKIAFQARLKREDGITPENDAVVFGHILRNLSGSGSSSGSSGGFLKTPILSLISREGDVAAGTTGVFAKFSDPICNREGVTVFRGTLKLGGDVTKDNDTGIWSNQRGFLELVAREGEQAPGTATGTLFHSFTAFVLPDHTGVAFLAKLRVGTGDATSKNNVGVWLADAEGNLNLVLRKGMDLNFEGETRTLSSFSIFNSSAGALGQGRHFTSGGSLLYRASFRGGGSGLFRYLP